MPAEQGRRKPTGVDAAITPARDSEFRTAKRPEAPQFRLRRNAYKAALTLHILASVGWFGLATFVALCLLAASIPGDAESSAAFFRSMELAPSASVPFGFAAVGSGALLGVGTSYGLTRHWWVVVKIVIAVAVIVTDALLVGSAAKEAVVSGVAPNSLYGATAAHVLVLVVATGLAVFKPSGRTPWTGPLSPLGQHTRTGADPSES